MADADKLFDYCTSKYIEFPDSDSEWSLGSIIVSKLSKHKYFYEYIIERKITDKEEVIKIPTSKFSNGHEIPEQLIWLPRKNILEKRGYNIISPFANNLFAHFCGYDIHGIRLNISSDAKEIIFIFNHNKEKFKCDNHKWVKRERQILSIPVTDEEIESLSQIIMLREIVIRKTVGTGCINERNKIMYGGYTQKTYFENREFASDLEYFAKKVLE